MNSYIIGILVSFSKINILLWILIAFTFAGGAIAFPISFFSNTNVLLGFCLIPLVIDFQGTKRVNWAYLTLFLLFGSIAFIYNVRMFYFLTLAFFLLFILEIFIGQLSYIILFLIAFMSPVFDQVTGILGFPIRLMLSSWSGNLLNYAGFDVKVFGNLIVLNNSDFTVDEACMGLNMLTISFIMGVFLIAFHSKKQKLKVNILKLTGFFMIVFGLNLLSNLLRIITLIVFKIMPENPLHELVGLFCISLYVVLPMYFFSKWLIKNHGTAINQVISNDKPVNYQTMTFLSFMASLLIVLGANINRNRNESVLAHVQVSMGNMQIIRLEKGLSKMVNSQILVYVKPIPEFFSGEHSPLFCWKGSGYKFNNINKIKIATSEVYVGVLSKTNSKLYTAWWYSNGEIQTIDQLDWRLRMLKGENKFSLVNVTSSDERILENNLRAIFEKKLLKINKPNV